ncbi:MAG: metallophosphoesterase [Clostridia bacterium]|nr:metallophosphoesterase [Clostridia bacterium]
MPYYLCNKCFYAKESDETPDTCIVCGSGKSAFTEVVPSLKQFIPDYWAKHVKEKINKIHENQARAGRRGISFAIISDIHWYGNRKHSAALLERIMDACAIPYVFNAGDTVSGAGICRPTTIINEMQNYSEAFKKLESRTLWALGNHDPAYSTFEAPMYYKQNLTKVELFEYMFRYETKYPDRTMSEDGLYFYADSKEYKTRLVVLNPYDVPNCDVNEDGSAKYNMFTTIGYRQTQLEWFANTALDVPSDDWTVVLCTHTNPSSGESPRNVDVVLGLIDSFRKGTKFEASTTHDIEGYNASISADYTGRGGEFAIWVSGHTHYDAVTVENGTLCTSVMSDWNHQLSRLPFERTAGTVMEHCFDVYTIDPVRHKLYVTRIGAGDDREFDYTPKG